jgi:two-component system, chemotaxis family, response regulator Rcp1
MLPSRERVLHVLLLEDNPGDVLLLREAVKSFYAETEVLVAYNGEQALRFIDELHFKPDIVFLDLNVPKIDGFGVLKKNRGAVVPIVVLTSSSNVMDKVRSMQFGASDYLEKPKDLAEYIRVIHAALRKWVDLNGARGSVGTGG